MAKTCGGIFLVLCRRTWFQKGNWGRKAGFLFLEGDAGLYIMGNAGRSNRVIIYIYARQTYPQFVAKFGGRATHHKEIRKKTEWAITAIPSIFKPCSSILTLAKALQQRR